MQTPTTPHRDGCEHEPLDAVPGATVSLEVGQR